MRGLLFLILVSGALLAVSSAHNARAERAETSNGVGVCISQVAIAPDEILGVNSLGSAIRTIAGPELPAFLNESRGACGEPPGPGHL